MKIQKLLRVCSSMLIVLCLSSCGSQANSLESPISSSQELLSESSGGAQKENPVTITPVHLRIQYGEDAPYPIYLDLCYPQVSGLDSKGNEDIINTMLYDVALKFLGDKITVTNIDDALAEAAGNALYRPSLTDLVAYVDYETIYCGNNYVSFRFTGSTTIAAAAVNTFEYLVTIDLYNASYLDLTACFNLDDILNYIAQENFEVISGQYMPGGWDGPEMKDQFIDAMRLGVDKEYSLKCHAYTSERWTNGTSEQCIQKGNEGIVYSEYDIYSARNFALSEEFIYIKFAFADSLDGFVVLKLPCNST